MRSHRLLLELDDVDASLTAAMAAWSHERVSSASRIVLRRRDGGFVLNIEAVWDDPAGDAVNLAWARACHAHLAHLVAAGHTRPQAVGRAGTRAA